jgi:hypothetical protein
MEGTTEGKPASVPRASGAKQGGEVRARWAWAEPSVWTDRMLEALERGVKGVDFTERGLLNLEAARAQASQSPPGQTTDWRAVCGRTARTVRREGSPGNRTSLPLSLSLPAGMRLVLTVERATWQSWER